MGDGPEDRYDTSDDTQPVQDMVAWFFTEYEDPSENCPRDDGEFEYIWGGPFHAEDVLTEKYEGVVTPGDLARAIEVLSEGGEWSKVPPADEEEDPEPDEDAGLGDEDDEPPESEP
jgi:hypothetical protein